MIRDHKGQVIGALHAQRSLMGRPFDAEAYGLMLATVFIKELRLAQVCLGDSKQVVDLLLNQGVDWRMGGCLIGDARQILNSCARWNTSHVYREANKAAHQLAKAALERPDDVYDIELCPLCIVSVVTNEMM